MACRTTIIINLFVQLGFHLSYSKSHFEDNGLHTKLGNQDPLLKNQGADTDTQTRTQISKAKRIGGPKTLTNPTQHTILLQTHSHSFTHSSPTHGYIDIFKKRPSNHLTQRHHHILFSLSNNFHKLRLLLNIK